MKKWLLSGLFILLLFTTACSSKMTDGLDKPDTLITANTVTVSGSLGSTSSNLSRLAVGENVNGYAYIVAVSLSGGESIKAKITNNAFSLELDPKVKYVFYFLNEYGIKVNEMQFGTDGSAAKIENDISLGTLTPSSSGAMEVKAEVIAGKFTSETKDEVKTTGEFNPELIKQELKETIKKTLEENNMGTVTDDKIIIEVKNDALKDTTNRIEISIKETSDCTDESITFDKVEIVQETKKDDGTTTISKVAVPVKTTDVKDNVEVVNAVVQKTEDVIEKATEATKGEISEDVKTGIAEGIKDGGNTIVIPPVEIKTVKFNLADQDGFREYVEKLRTTYSEFYGEFLVTIDGDNLEVTRKNIKAHDNVIIGTLVNEKITKTGSVYSYEKDGKAVKTGSNISAVLPTSLPVLKALPVFSSEDQTAFQNYINKIKSEYYEFYGNMTSEITGDKLTLTRYNLKAHDNVTKGTKIVEEITKVGTTYSYVRTTGLTKGTPITGSAIVNVIPELPTLIALHVFLNTELTEFKTYYASMQTKYSGFYGSFAIVATENELKITKVCTKSHDSSVTKGETITQTIIKQQGKYKYTYKKGDIVTKTDEGASLKEVLPTLTDLTETLEVWNLTAADFRGDIRTPAQLYAKIKTLKTKSNSQAMNYLFQAVLDTESIVETDLRNQILATLSGKIPGINESNYYNYADQAFKTPAETYKVLSSSGLKALDAIAKNLDLAYKTNETVRFDKVGLTDGYNISLTPAHFKVISGAFKTYIAQLNLIASYKFENNDDLVKFAEFIEDWSKTERLDIDFMRDVFPTLHVMEVNTTLQTNALKYMREGSAELLSAANTLPTVIGEPNKNSPNMLSLPLNIQPQLVETFTLINNLLKDRGAVIEVSYDNNVIEVVRVDLSKLYTLDLKALIAEFLAGTAGKYGVEAGKIIDVNVNKSTFGGIFPNGL